MTTSRSLARFLRVGGALVSWSGAVLSGAMLSGCARVDERGTTELVPAPDLAPAATEQGPGPDLAAADSGGDAATNGFSVCDLHKLRINELQTAGVSEATDEFIELYNPCSATVALQGGKIVYRAATSGGDNFVFFTFAAQTVPAHGYFVLANGSYTGTADQKPFQSGGGMAAGGGGIALKDPLDNIVDSVGWGSAVNAFVEGSAPPPPVGGQALARLADGSDSEDNLADFRLAVPTPGAAN